MSWAVGLKHCLDEIDNTIKPVPVWMHHYDPLLHQPLQMEHTSVAQGPFGREKYNYKRLARKCVLFTMCRQACTSYVWAACISHCCPQALLSSSVLKRGANWRIDGLITIWVFFSIFPSYCMFLSCFCCILRLFSQPFAHNVYKYTAADCVHVCVCVVTVCKTSVKILLKIWFKWKLFFIFRVCCFKTCDISAEQI